MQLNTEQFYLILVKALFNKNINLVSDIERIELIKKAQKQLLDALIEIIENSKESLPNENKHMIIRLKAANNFHDSEVFSKFPKLEIYLNQALNKLINN